MEYRRSYWSQIANPWVSAAVLVGGLVSSLLLYTLVHLSNLSDTNFESVHSNAESAFSD